MKKRQGFTLIELLAVIVILAVIAIIVTPMIMNTIKSARENSAKSSALNYINAVEEYVASENAKNPDNTEFSSTDPYDVTKTPVSNVEVTGQKPTSGTVTIVKGTVTDFDLVMGNYELKRTGIAGDVTITLAGSTPVETGIPVESIKFTQDYYHIHNGKVVVVITPTDATNQNVTYTISDPNLTVASDGTVSCIGLCTDYCSQATITATTSNGKTATCTIDYQDGGPC